MRRVFIGIFAFLFASLACRAFTPESIRQDRVTPDIVTPSPLPGGTSATPTVTSSPTVSPTTQPTPTHTPIPATSTASPTATPTGPVFEVRTHPDDGLFVGDQVSFEVIPPADLDLLDGVLSISDPLADGEPMDAQFTPFGIGGRNQATFYWKWDTSELGVGEHPLSFSIQPQGITWTQRITLDAAADIPAPEPLAGWDQDESDCCLFYFITETAAAREITTTLAIADELADRAVQTLSVDFTEPLVVTLMPRVLGQGGFASNEIYISFLDRNYAGNLLEMVLHHEMVHILDYRLGGEMRPTILIEGLAVYLSGGHYKPEALMPRAAALLSPAVRDDELGLGWYLPLRPLSDDFYNAQHEIGYIQAGALVEYMVNTWGWEAYSAFYRDIHPIQNGTQSDALDAALQAHFELTLDELETDFLAVLRAQEISAETMDDIRLTVEFFDAMRGYQQALDPSAYFLTAWLPDGVLMRENGIVADLVRRPSKNENIALETLLVEASQALKAGDYLAAEGAIGAVNAVLEAMEASQSDPFDAHHLAKAYFEIVLLLQESGYQAERIEVADGTATVIASQGWPDLARFEFAAENNHWILVSSQ